MSFNTAPAQPAPTTNAAPALPALLPGLPGGAAPTGTTASAPSALPLFAQVLDVAGVTTQDTAAVSANDGDSHDDADSDAAGKSGGNADSGSLPAMALPVIGLPLAPMPVALPQQADAAAAEARGAAQTQVQASAAQANPALNISLHPAAVTLSSQAVPQPAGRDTREPLAAANPLPAAKGGADSATALPFESLLKQAAPVAAAVAAPARDGERAASPAASAAPNLGLTGAVANATPAAAGGDTIKLNGPAQQWQEPLREALGERLQTQIGRNSEHATIRLDPPMLGRIEISIRHTAGALQVNVTASNTEVLRQLQGIGENMRSDLAQRQYTDVAVNISATPRSPAAQAFAEGDARGQRQPGRQQDEAEPGRALSDGTPAGTSSSNTYAMHEREYN
ncbi:flagellar hook-length control protein FliK [Janthinobacterium sp. SUN118]|uniref:flagellar hook-length control protein FliK n=1 Tax=Janthinobacterium sp. SUN118 TaxID=3004100 RepID=UPI0025AF3EF4|nr:flagellar hook-length control protein FliK [Janthinobacterium sp. SUN118]MDN2710780.1 flagellar hook-length control protein FliK [Janthinobacterium sp. SUN118]